MKNVLSVFFCLSVLFLVSQANAYIEHDVAVLRVMNKAAGKATTVRVPVGRSASFEKLDLLVRTCKQTDPFQAEDFFTFVEISKGDKIFSGWMSKNAPGDNPLQHPDYDVWVVKCE